MSEDHVAEMERMRVTVVDREAMKTLWGSPGLFSVILRTVDISTRCPVCGGPRGLPYKRRFCEDGDWYDVDCWENPCGHLDRYTDVLAEAASLKTS